METVILILTLVLIGLVLAAILRASKLGRLEEKMVSALNERLHNFQGALSQTVENARREVSESKNIISGHAVDTLKTIRDMGQTVERLLEQQREAQELGNSLKYLLQTPKLRGNYGEEILEEMLDRVIPGLWKKQFPVEDGERVDAVVKYKDTIIPIDAKFPREIYERYMEAGDEGEKKKKWKLYEEGLKIQINNIKTKYIKPHRGTSDFALMFIPSESIYYETIAEKNFLGEPCGIYDYARNNKVVPVSPSTFYAFLQIIMLGIRNVDILKNARKLQQALVKIERNFTRFYAKYEEIGSSLEKAQKAYRVGDDHIKRFKDNVEATLKIDLPQARRIENDDRKSTPRK